MRILCGKFLRGTGRRYEVKGTREGKRCPFSNSNYRLELLLVEMFECLNKIILFPLPYSLFPLLPPPQSIWHTGKWSRWWRADNRGWTLCLSHRPELQRLRLWRFCWWWRSCIGQQPCFSRLWWRWSCRRFRPKPNKWNFPCWCWWGRHCWCLRKSLV